MNVFLDVPCVGMAFPFQDLGKAKGKRLLYDGVNFTLPRGGVVGIIGANGAGKVRETQSSSVQMNFRVQLCRCGSFFNEPFPP